jgi:hypothetical protein
MEWDQRIPGLFKLNMFILVPPDLYEIIKNYKWGTGGSAWTGFKAVPDGVASDIMHYRVPAVTLPGGTREEVGGYEKQPGVKYYDANVPSLNLEFKWLAVTEVKVKTPAKGEIMVPKVAYCLNVHVKEEKAELVQGKKFYQY